MLNTESELRLSVSHEPSDETNIYENSAAENFLKAEN